MESFTHVLLQPDARLFPLPQPCIQLFKLLHLLPNQDTFHLQNPRHASSTSIFQLTCPFVANITSSDPCVSAASGMLLLWLNSIIFPIRLGSSCGQGLCLSIGLTSRHQPLGSPSCMTFMHKPYSFVSRSWSVPLIGSEMLVAQPHSLPTHSKLPNELLDPPALSSNTTFSRKPSLTSRLKFLILSSHAIQ